MAISLLALRAPRLSTMATALQQNQDPASGGPVPLSERFKQEGSHVAFCRDIFRLKISFIVYKSKHVYTSDTAIYPLCFLPRLYGLSPILRRATARRNILYACLCEQLFGRSLLRCQVAVWNL